MSDIIAIAEKFCSVAETFRRSRAPDDLTQLRLQRALMVQALLAADMPTVQSHMSGPLAGMVTACLRSGVRQQPRIPLEETMLAACQADIVAEWNADRATRAGLAALLLSWHACEVGPVPDLQTIPTPMRPAWFAYLLELPDGFAKPGDAERYVSFLQLLCGRVGEYLSATPDGGRDLIEAMAQNPLFADSYFTGMSFAESAAARADILDRIADLMTATSSPLTIGSPGSVAPSKTTLAPLGAQGSVQTDMPPSASLNRKQRRAAEKRDKAPAAPAAPINMEAERLFATATALHQKGDIATARPLYLEALKQNPMHGGALNNLGLLEADQGNFAEAEALYRRASLADPSNPNAFMNLGNLYKAHEKHDQALASYEQALRIDPNHSMTYVNLGNEYQHLGKIKEATGCYEKAIRINPDLADAHLNMGNLLSRTNRADEAVPYFERALAIKPDYAAAYNNLGMSLLSLGKHDRAITCFEQAMKHRPNYLDAFLNLGSLYKDLGKGDKAADYYEKILAIDPDHPGALSNLAFSLNYSDSVSAQELARQHFRVGAQMERKFVPARKDFDNVRDPGRKLRIGYVSPDLRYHAVTNFFEPLIRAHDRSAVEIFCYAEVLTPDAMTAKLQTMADHWVFTIGMSDDAIAARIRADKIDILVDMAGHSNNNRLATFARRPAPISVTWLGYANTTGLKNIDYRFVDSVSDPPGVADPLASETLVRLDGGFLCFNTFVPAPDPAPPPCVKNGFVTFGSFNNLPKLSPSALDAWSKLMKRLPTAKLVLKNRFLGEPGTRELVLSRFAERGIDIARVTLLAGIPDLTGHLAAYHDVDIGLDSFPYNGTTTTCEALWMGVPVIGLAGDRHLARVGASILTHAGVPELVARDQEDYVNIAATLATNVPRLTEYHATLRDRLKASPLCDGGRFARAVEKAYREMWRQWCEGVQTDGTPRARASA